MVETEKVCNHKVSTGSGGRSELVQRTKSVGDNGSVRKDKGASGVSSSGTFDDSKDPYGASFQRANTIATGNSKTLNGYADSEEFSGRGPRHTLERSTSAYYVYSSLPQVVHNVRPKTSYRNNVSR